MRTQRGSVYKQDPVRPSSVFFLVQTVATRMGFCSVPVRMATPGFHPHALIPRNATFTQLEGSRAVTVISTTSPTASISVKEQVRLEGCQEESSGVGEGGGWFSGPTCHREGTLASHPRVNSLSP